MTFHTPTFSIILVLFFFTACDSNQSSPHQIKKQNQMVLIPSGVLNMGGDNDQTSANEFPKHKTVIDAFWMDETEVTNKQFARFVEATGYLTIAERPVDWEEMKKDLPPNTPKD